MALISKFAWKELFAVLTDLTSVLISGAVSYWLICRVYALFGYQYESWSRVVDERFPAFAITVCLLLCGFYLTGQYHRRIPFWDKARDVVVGSFYALMFEGFLIYAYKSDVSRILTFVSWALAPFVIMTGRALYRRFTHTFGVGLTDLLVVGRADRAQDIARIVSSDPHFGLRVATVLTPRRLADVVEAIEQNPGIRCVAIALSGVDDVENEIVAYLRSKDMDLIISPVPNGVVSGMDVRYLLGEDMILLMDRIEVTPLVSRLAKRLFDIIVATLMLLVAAVPMAIVAILIKRDGGSVFFRHERIGMSGRPFLCTKFRSMSSNAQELLEEYLANDPERRREWEESRKLKNDPRVTAFGRFIRKTTLDELPQLFNVLKGDMSLIGPRPVTKSELEYYGNTTALYTSVRPGLTGLWQVSGRSDLNYDQRVRLDTWYVRNWTPWHDIAILLKTIPAVLFRRGAY